VEIGRAQGGIEKPQIVRAAETAEKAERRRAAGHPFSSRARL
jgi:hypothetical protein